MPSLRPGGRLEGDFYYLEEITERHKGGGPFPAPAVPAVSVIFASLKNWIYYILLLLVVADRIAALGCLFRTLRVRIELRKLPQKAPAVVSLGCNLGCLVSPVGVTAFEIRLAA